MEKRHSIRKIVLIENSYDLVFEPLINLLTVILCMLQSCIIFFLSTGAIRGCACALLEQALTAALFAEEAGDIIKHIDIQRIWQDTF